MPTETTTKDGDGEEKINEDYEDRRGLISARSTHARAASHHLQIYPHAAASPPAPSPSVTTLPALTLPSHFPPPCSPLPPRAR